MKTSIQTLVEQLVKEELNCLYERQRATPSIMYHGTSSKFLPKIFQLGMIPDPTKGKWKDDELEAKADLLNPSLRSLRGSYWTDNLGVAISSAGNVRRELGGNSTIIVAQIVQQTAYADEDDLRGPVQRAFGKMVQEEFGYAGTTENAWRIKGLIDANDSKYRELVSKFSDTLHQQLTKNPKKPVDKNLMKKTFDAFLERMLAHMPIEEGWYNKSRYIESYERGLEEAGVDWEEARKKAREMYDGPLPKYNKVAAEKAFLDALEELTIRYRESAMPAGEEEYRMRTNIRVPQPVGFRGRNKIIAIVVIRQDEDRREKTLELVYGSLPSKFVQDYTQHWGPKFQIIDKKTGTVIHDTLEESAGNAERYITEKMALSNYKDFCELVANAYEELPDFEPEAVASYKALISHIEKMYQRMLSKVKVEFVEGQPYDSQKQMAQDVKETGVLKISTDYNQHDIFTPEQNLKFRAVHDYIVHILANVDFSDKGEVAAFNAHAKLLPQKAIPAAFTEIVGQACYANAKGSFPKQKIAIMQGFDFRNLGQVKGYDIEKKKLVREPNELEAEEEVRTR